MYTENSLIISMHQHQVHFTIGSKNLMYVHIPCRPHPNLGIFQNKAYLDATFIQFSTIIFHCLRSDCDYNFCDLDQMILMEYQDTWKLSWLRIKTHFHATFVQSVCFQCLSVTKLCPPPPKKKNISTFFSLLNDFWSNGLILGQDAPYGHIKPPFGLR